METILYPAGRHEFEVGNLASAEGIHIKLARDSWPDAGPELMRLEVLGFSNGADWFCFAEITARGGIIRRPNGDEVLATALRLSWPAERIGEELVTHRPNGVKLVMHISQELRTAVEVVGF